MRWPAGEHLVVTRSGIVLAGHDPLATASPTLTVDQVRDVGVPVDEDGLRELAELTTDPSARDWSRRWQPSAAADPERAPLPTEALIARLPTVLAPGVDGFVAAGPNSTHGRVR